MIPLLDLVVEETAETISSFTPAKEEETKKKEDMHMADSDYYWNSYAHFGIHEVTTQHSGKGERQSPYEGWSFLGGVGDAQGPRSHQLLPRSYFPVHRSNRREDRASLSPSHSLLIA